MIDGEVVVTLTGNLVDDPELRFTNSGRSVAHFTVACTPTPRGKQPKRKKSSTTTFMKCYAWGEMGENMRSSMHKGDRVTVYGSLKQRSYLTKDNKRQDVWEVEAVDVAASLEKHRVELYDHKPGVVPTRAKKRAGGSRSRSKKPSTHE